MLDGLGQVVGRGVLPRGHRRTLEEDIAAEGRLDWFSPDAEDLEFPLAGADLPRRESDLGGAANSSESLLARLAVIASAGRNSGPAAPRVGACSDGPFEVDDRLAGAVDPDEPTVSLRPTSDPGDFHPAAVGIGVEEGVSVGRAREQGHPGLPGEPERQASSDRTEGRARKDRARRQP